MLHASPPRSVRGRVLAWASPNPVARSRRPLRTCSISVQSFIPPQQVTPIQMPGQDQRTQMRTNRRPRRRGGPMGGGSGRAPVTEYDEMQELEAARERNDLDVADLREMSVAELRQVGRDLEIDTRAEDR